MKQRKHVPRRAIEYDDGRKRYALIVLQDGSSFAVDMDLVPEAIALLGATQGERAKSKAWRTVR